MIDPKPHRLLVSGTRLVASEVVVYRCILKTELMRCADGIFSIF